MTCQHFTTRRSRYLKNMLVCSDCGSLLDRNGLELTDGHDFHVMKPERTRAAVSVSGEER
jgi:hypothetical protein